MMRLQVLVACLDQNVTMLSEYMNLHTEAVICNQANRNAYMEYDHNGRRIRVWTFAERGVGRNRNNALLRAEGDLVLFADEDIVYTDDYEDRILRAFEENPDADGLFFNVEAEEGRKTYENMRRKRIRWYNYGRYPTYSLCLRREALLKANVWFSLLFGGGAPYSNGEDSLFIHDCLKKGLKIYGVPIHIGNERRTNSTSTWFHGYNEKFFYDRGVLYHYLYGMMAVPFGLRFLLKNRKIMCGEIPFRQAYSLLKKGVREAG